MRNANQSLEHANDRMNLCLGGEIEVVKCAIQLVDPLSSIIVFHATPLR